MLPCVEIEPRTTATASVIWLHGLGADGHDFEPVVPHLGLPADLAVRFVFPHAPAIAVTINDGYVMPAWYDILEMDLGRRVDEAQLRASATAVGELIARENARGVPSERIVIAGFSQGGAVGYELALTWPERLAGLVAISTYFATRPSITPHAASAGLPILVCHGRHDTLVPETLGQDAARALTAMGYAVEYRAYEVEHGIDMEEIRDIGAWLAAALA
ncbi:MAG: dienelactone hydrolase family protein [Gammaproteobacteria bacterium]